MTQDLERLRSIKSFPQLELVTYLRDQLDWEFETEDVEDLTYEYSQTSPTTDSTCHRTFPAPSGIKA